MTKVTFVGAGPGDPELITLKGYRALQAADVVIYAGSLVNPALLGDCKAEAEIFNSASLNLDEILSIIEDRVNKGMSVVRLHTGDASIYGSIREQIEELSKLGIDYDVIPGVSSFLGAAASLGVEYTVPQVSQSVILTRMAGRTPVPESESIRSLASHQCSMVIFLSVQMIEELVEELLAGGYHNQTPVAVVYKATWPEEKIIQSQLSDITQKVKEAGIKKTALILVGEFLGEEFHYSYLYDKDFSHEYRK